jgi:acyl carrier protein
MKKNMLKYINNNLLSEEKVDAQTELFDSGLLDSIGLMELVVFIEHEFNVKIEDYEIIDRNANTVNKIVKLVNQKM